MSPAPVEDFAVALAWVTSLMLEGKYTGDDKRAEIRLAHHAALRCLETMPNFPDWMKVRQ